MRALGVVKADPVVDDPFSLEAVGDFMQIDGLLLQGSPQPFDEDVVQITAPTIYYRQVIACNHREALRF